MNIIIDKDVWLNSQLSIARYYGGANINGEPYQILPPDGDLVNAKYAKFYRQLGRKKLQEYIDKGLTLKEIKDEYKKSQEIKKENSESTLL